ncbi:hypothetical protein [Anaerobacillus arseniciselenatis]|uniref:hypothetical protein n=1 Tax=Anaerobacillus arseniciselenatis TaxID=85682 RepID=UPI001471358F|nr:hypothetical protein [Anaerobacillus arseniciselenatis]
MKHKDFLNEGDLKKVKRLQEKLKKSNCYDERKRLVTKKALVIEKARVNKSKQKSE